ncbi:MAG: hypothetical protein ACI3WR_02030 [Oscillospiraceae bacterium]
MKETGKRKTVISVALLMALASANGYFQGKCSSTPLGVWLTVFVTLLFIVIAANLLSAAFKRVK